MESFIVLIIVISAFVVGINSVRSLLKYKVNNIDGSNNTVNSGINKNENNNDTSVSATISELVVELFKAIELSDHDLYIKYTSDPDLKIDEYLKDMMVSDCKRMYSMLKTEQKENLYTFMSIWKKYGSDAILEYNDQISKVTKLKEYFEIQAKYDIKNEIKYYTNLFKGIMPSPFLNDEEEVEYRETISNISDKLEQIEKMVEVTEKLQQNEKELTHENQLDKDLHKIAEILDFDIHGPSNPMDNITITIILNSIGSSSNSRTEYLYTTPLIICETIIFNFAITKLFLLITFGMTSNYVKTFFELKNLLIKFIDSFYNGSIGNVRLIFENREKKYFDLYGKVPADKLIDQYFETFAMLLLFDKNQAHFIPINNMSELGLDRIKLCKPLDEINDYMMFWFPLLEIDINKLLEFVKENEIKHK